LITPKKRACQPNDRLASSGFNHSFTQPIRLQHCPPSASASEPLRLPFDSFPNRYRLGFSIGLRHAVPLVCVQIIAGIALGPSGFGRLAPELFHLVFSPATLTPLAGISSIAVMLFAYIAGLHLEPASILGRGRAFVVVSGASVVVPMFAGIFVGLWIAARNPIELGDGVDPFAFAFAIGICISVTALPVLGAILREMNLLGRRIGDYALAIAAVNDAVLWLLLAGLMAVIAGGASGRTGLILTLCGTPVYLFIMFRYVRRYLLRLAPHLLRNGEISERALAALCGIALGSAIATELLGLHYVVGAFLAGAVMPPELRQRTLDRLQLVVIGILMPFFFMTTGLRTFIDLNSAGFLEIMLITTAIGMIAKIGGTMLAARFTGDSWADAFTLGALVQPKGLMELVVLTVLLDLGIISTTAFSALTVMAVVTTLLAMPLARLGLSFGDRHRADPGAAPPLAASTTSKK
jgi:Kef-type K+ transport system membrane component KefB